MFDRPGRSQSITKTVGRQSDRRLRTPTDCDNYPMSYPCPCCGYLQFGEPPGSYEICDICFWEDDPIQLRWPNWKGGANRLSLIDAQRAFADLGAKEASKLRHVRLPGPADLRDEGWRPIDRAADSFEPSGEHTDPWPKDRTTLYWWRPSFWRSGR